MVVTSTSDPYAILGVDRSATDDVIAAAHKKLARTYHPDVAGDHATVDMMRINAAFDRIRDRRRRAAYAQQEADERYDETVAQRGSPATPGDTRTYAANNGLDWAPERDGTGGAGKPPGRPSGSVLPFGRHIGWSIGEIARVDPGYLVWLEDRRDGRPYLDEIDKTLRLVGYRKAEDPGPVKTGRFGR
jgi:curved DNA-binding protein CbpA